MKKNAYRLQLPEGPPGEKGCGGLSRLFPLVQLGLWLLFLGMDLLYLDSTWVKFASICLCALTALGGGDRLVAAAQTLTVLADWFLLVRNDHYLWGVGVFTLVQLLYALRLTRRYLPLRSLLLLVCGLAMVRDPLTGLTLFYFSNLVLNGLAATLTGERLFATGLWLFVCCDLTVGCWNLGLFPAFTRWGMWFFYLPSQVLIVLSAQRKEESAHGGE